MQRDHRDRMRDPSSIRRISRRGCICDAARNRADRAELEFRQPLAELALSGVNRDHRDVHPAPVERGAFSDGQRLGATSAAQCDGCLVLAGVRRIGLHAHETHSHVAKLERFARRDIASHRIAGVAQRRERLPSRMGKYLRFREYGSLLALGGATHEGDHDEPEAEHHRDTTADRIRPGVADGLRESIGARATAATRRGLRAEAR